MGPTPQLDPQPHPTEDENEVWGYIIKCRQLLNWQLTEDENADLREVVFPALARKNPDRDYDRHETLHGRLRDKQYEDKLRQVMHIYHQVVMEVCDWMIYNKEYFHLLIGNYTTFDQFANAVDAAIMDECRGIQSRVWTRKGIVELDNPIQVGTPHSSSDSETISESVSPSVTSLSSSGPGPELKSSLTIPQAPTPRPTPTTATVIVNAPPKHVLTPALAVLTHGAPARHHAHIHAHGHAKPRLLHTPPHTPPEDAKPAEDVSGKPDPSSVLFKPEPVPAPIDLPTPVISAASMQTPEVPPIPMQSIDLMDDETYKPGVRVISPSISPEPQTRRGSLVPGSPRPLAPPISRRPTIAVPLSSEPRQLAAPAPRRATIAYPSHGPSPLAPRPSSVAPISRPATSGPGEPHRGSTWELSLVNNYNQARGPSLPQEPGSPDEPMGPTFDVATPFYTPSRAPSPQPRAPQTEPPSPPPPMGPTFEIATPFFTPSRRGTAIAPPPPGPASPVEPMGPTFEVATPFYTKSRRPTIAAEKVELGSPTMPDGPTFPISTPFFTYASRSLSPPRALSPEPSLGPTFPVRTPLITYSTRPLPDPEPASPDEPTGPTFPVNTPLFTYAASTIPPNKKPLVPQVTNGTTVPTSPPWKPTFAPNYTPTLEPRPTISVPGVKIIAPSLASSKLDSNFPSSLSPSPVASEISPKSDVFPESANKDTFEETKVIEDVVVPEVVTIAPSETAHNKEHSEPESVSPAVPVSSTVADSVEQPGFPFPVAPDSVDVAPELPPKDFCSSKAADSVDSPEPDAKPKSPDAPVSLQSVKSVDSFPSPKHDDDAVDLEDEGDKFPCNNSISLSNTTPNSTNNASLPATDSPASTNGDLPGAPAGSKRSGKSLSLAKRPSIFWDRDVDFTPSNPPAAHASNPSTSSAPAHSSAHPNPHGGNASTRGVRPMSSNGSLQHQWWKIGRGRRNSTHSQD